MKKDLHYSVQLSDGPTQRLCWVDRQVKAGDRVTLKNSDEPERLWTVDWVGNRTVASGQLPDMDWHVGGL